MRVGVVDKHGVPLMPCHAARARKLLRDKKADVFSINPFVIRLLNREGCDTQPMEVKIDPGSKTTGLVLTIQGAKRGWFAVEAAEMSHRGQSIVDNLKSRRASRSFRRSRKTRYRAARFLNRKRPAGWLPPSLRSRVDNISSRAKKWQKFYPITGLRSNKCALIYNNSKTPKSPAKNTNKERFSGMRFGNTCSRNGTERARIAKRKTFRSKLSTFTPKAGAEQTASATSVWPVNHATQKREVV